MKDLILFQSNDEIITLPVNIDSETVWLSLDQMAQLFDRDKSAVSRHISNIFKEKEIEKNSVVAKFATTAADGKTYKVNYYNLDVIISVGYRVKSQRGVEFRHWANSVLKDYILKGYAVNDSRLEQLGQTVQLMKRALDSLDSSQILSVVESYTTALDLLDD
ncbi:MAG: virulence RhuM family protein, partial [Oscillospiraceae bacterium]|nr:virulence RhuM family protein [Oscillospiraceae bacterium]